MDVFAFFGNLFNQIINFMSKPIYLGGGITISLFGVFIGLSVLTLFIVVVRKLFD